MAPAAPSSAPIRLAVVNDYAQVGDGIRRFLAPFGDRVTVVGSLDLAPGAASPLAPSRIDVALYDTFGRVGIDLDHVRRLAADPSIGAVAVYAFDAREDVIDQAVAAGATGFLSKAMAAGQLARSLGEVVAATAPVVRGSTGVGRSTREERGWPGQELGLSEREAEVAALAALGHRNSEIAEALQVSIDTVKTHLARAFRKLDVHNRTALSALVHTSPTFRRTEPALVA